MNDPRAELRRFEVRLARVCAAARMLPAITPRNAASERARLLTCIERGESPTPNWQYAPTRIAAAAFHLIDELRAQTSSLPAEALHQDKLDELELELRLIDAVGRPRRVRELARRRFGTGAREAPTAQGPVALGKYARSVLDQVAPDEEPRSLPAEGPQASLAAVVRSVAREAGLAVAVRVDPSLAACAASAEGTVYVADRAVGPREAMRLAIHEVLGHLVSAAQGRRQPLRILEWGTAGAFADQEGVALVLEHLHGLLDGTRLRTLAARVVATDCVHAGASFGDTARRLHREEGFSAAAAVAIAERAYRGGGVARDASYLFGWLRVRDALERGVCTLDELRLGRVGLDAVPRVRELVREGWALPARVLSARVAPNFSRNFCSTSGGTTPPKSPPRAAASLIRLELT